MIRPSAQQQSLLCEGGKDRKGNTFTKLSKRLNRFCYTAPLSLAAGLAAGLYGAANRETPT
ncbi:MAG TPA: hypothetical protein VN715_21920 [Roseiarcus sp.]|nr:hypothetical protein [Roseiarcus sp.]